jgi:PAS domain S-box-containing protein
MDRHQLSRQEERVLNLARQGFGDKQIALELGLSPDTVRTYWQRIRTKIGAGTRAEIVATISDKETEAKVKLVEQEKNVLLQEILRRTTVEKALRANEQYWRRLADAVPSMVFISDQKGTPLYFNSRFYEYTGLDTEDALKGGWIRTVYRDDVRSVAQELKHRAKEAGFGQLAIRIRRKDGAYRWHMNRSVPIRNEAGQIVQWFGTSTDIHEEMQMREALEERQSQLTQAERIARLGQYEYDVASRQARWSENLFEMFELPVVSEWFDSQQYLQLVHPDDQQSVENALNRAIETGADFELSYRIRLPSEKVMWIRAIGWTETGVKIGRRIRGTIQDVTESMNRQLELERRREQMEFAEAASDIGSFYTDVAHNTIEWSPNLYRMIGRDPALPPMWGSEFRFLIHEDDRQRFDEGIVQLRNGSAIDLTLRFPQPVGGHKLFQFRAEPKPEGGNFGFLRDVTPAVLQAHRTMVVGNAAPCGIFQTDEQRRVLYANNRALEFIGTSSDQLLGKDFFEILPPALRPDAERKWREANDYKMPFEFSAIQTESGGSANLRLQVHQFIVEGTIHGFVGLVSPGAPSPHPSAESAEFPIAGPPRSRV